jgi:hypothetical protein
MSGRKKILKDRMRVLLTDIDIRAPLGRDRLKVRLLII